MHAGSQIAHDAGLAGQGKPDAVPDGVIVAISRIAGLLDPTVIATRAAQEARALAEMDLVGIAIVDGPNSVVMKGAVGEASEWFPNMRLHVDPGQGFAGTILSTRRPLRLDTLATEDGIHAFDPVDGEPSGPMLDKVYASHLRRRVAPEHVREYIGIPIALDDGVFGVLYAGNRTRESRAEGRMALFRFATMLAPILAASLQARRNAVAELARERERIAFSLHDTVGQILFGIGVSAQRLGRSLAELPDSARIELKFIEQEVARASAHLRGILSSLSETEDEADLVTEAKILAGMLTARSGISADVLVSGTPRKLPSQAFVTLVAVVGEGLHNVEKHAGARSVIVSLRYGASDITVTVQDDGVGLVAGKTPGAAGAGAGRGLTSLRRRVERLRGRLSIRTLEGGGTALRAVI